MMQVVYWRLDSCTETLLLSVVVDSKDGDGVVLDSKDGDGLHFEKSSLNFSVFVLFFKAKQKMNCGLLFLQKVDWCLNPKFQGNVFGSSKGKERISV